MHWIIEASERMLASAKVGAWDEVSVHLAERDRLLHTLPTEGAGMMALLTTLQRHNDEVRSLVSQAREDVGLAMGQHHRTHRALNSYLGAASS